jgi:integrating conjugative element protein (TIGR03758 family)
MEDAFREAAGFNPRDLQMVIRGIVAALFSLWSAWVIYNQLKLVFDDQMTTIQWLFNSITVVVILTIVLVIVGT